MAEWSETHRGIVPAWECDTFDHLTIAYYFERFEDAALEAARRCAAAGPTIGLYVRHLREFRAGDVLHIVSAPVACDGEVLTLGHKVFDSATAELATTIEQRLRPATAWHGALAAWDGPQRAVHPVPESEDGFLPSARSVVKSWEVGADGALGWQHLVHRLSGACLHACAAFGMTPGYMRQNRRGYSTFELDLAIERLPPVGTRITVATGIMQIGNSSIRLLHAMRDAETGALLARMSQFGVHFDMDRRRPAPLPDDLREAALGLVRKAS